MNGNSDGARTYVGIRSIHDTEDAVTVVVLQCARNPLVHAAASLFDATMSPVVFPDQRIWTMLEKNAGDFYMP